MVIRRQLRAVLIPLALYAVSGSAASYFVWHAYNGSRGLKAKEEYRQKIAELTKRLHVVQDERAGWERRIAMMSAEIIDRDLLEEEAASLGPRFRRTSGLVFEKACAVSMVGRALGPKVCVFPCAGTGNRPIIVHNDKPVNRRSPFRNAFVASLY